MSCLATHVSLFLVGMASVAFVSPATAVTLSWYLTIGVTVHTLTSSATASQLSSIRAASQSSPFAASYSDTGQVYLFINTYDGFHVGCRWLGLPTTFGSLSVASLHQSQSSSFNSLSVQRLSCTALIISSLTSKIYLLRWVL